MKIGIDVDGVLADLMTPWLNRCNAALREKYKDASGVVPAMDWSPDDLDRWDFWNQVGIPEADVWAMFTPDIYQDVKPFAGALKAINAVREQGHEIVYITSCQNIGEFEAKTDWIRRHDFYVKGDWAIPVGKPFWYKTKADVADGEGVEWLVDDSVEHVEAWPKYALLVSQPHNRARLYAGKRIKSLRELPQLTLFSKVLVSLPSEPQADGDGTEPMGLPKGIVVETTFDTFKDIPTSAIRTFGTGATRDADTGKHDPEGFLSPLVIERFNAFMHKNRYQKDGSIRDSDNWQKGIPLVAYMKSGWRHFLSWWKAHRSGQPLSEMQIDELCALLFNVQGYLHETLKAKDGSTEQRAA